MSRYIHKWYTPVVLRVFASSEPEFVYYGPCYDPSKLPVKLTMVDDKGNYHSATRWYDNFDGFWNDGPQGRGFSL
jgi:hypothetical protein